LKERFLTIKSLSYRQVRPAAGGATGKERLPCQRGRVRGGENARGSPARAGSATTASPRSSCPHFGPSQKEEGRRQGTGGTAC